MLNTCFSIIISGTGSSAELIPPDKSVTWISTSGTSEKIFLMVVLISKEKKYWSPLTKIKNTNSAHIIISIIFMPVLSLTGAAGISVPAAA